MPDDRTNKVEQLHPNPTPTTRGHMIAAEIRRAKLNTTQLTRAAAAETVAAAASGLLQHWATWALLQAGSLAGQEPLAVLRRQALLDGGAGNLIDEDPENGIAAYNALETLDAAVAQWRALAALAQPPIATTTPKPGPTSKTSKRR